MSTQTVIYVRISSDVTGGGQGVARQEADCRALAKKLGWAVTKVYRDNDVSAYSGRTRPEYQRLLADIESGKVGAVLAWHTDRLHRSPRELEQFIELVERRGVLIQTVQTGPLDLSTAAGRMGARIHGAVARHESEHKSDRLTRKLRQNAIDGKHHGGGRPYGYEEDRVTIREDEAAVIREGAARVLAGETIRSIMRDFNAREIPTAQGKKWMHPSLLQTLKRARIAGLRAYHGEIIGDAEWPAILPPETWRAMMSILSDPARVTNPGKGGNRPQHLLSTIARCGYCGGRMIVNGGRLAKDGTRTPNYRCADSHVSRLKSGVDEFVTGVILGRLGKSDAAMLMHAPDDVPARKAALAEADRMRHRLNEAAQMFADGLIDAAQLRTITGQLQPRLIELDAAAEPPSDRAHALSELIGAKDVAAKWEEMTTDQKRLVISTLVEIRVFKAPRRSPVFLPDGIEVTWK